MAVKRVLLRNEYSIRKIRIRETMKEGLKVKMIMQIREMLLREQ